MPISLSYFSDKDITHSSVGLFFSLSHLPLSASQLFILCQYGLTFDCFYSLGELLYQDNRINSITYELFLRFFKNSRFGRHYEMFIRSFLNRDPKNPKEKINIRILNDA